MTSLKGKTLFVSGGSRGIGLAIALRAARDGANVVIAAKTAELHPRLKGTIYTAADEVRAAGGKALPIICDIREEAQVIAAACGTDTASRTGSTGHGRTHCHASLQPGWLSVGFEPGVSPRSGADRDRSGHLNRVGRKDGRDMEFRPYVRTPSNLEEVS